MAADVAKGTLRLITQLEQVSARQVVTLESPIMPSEVTHLRISGVNQGGELVFGPVVAAKASEITVPGLPVTVTRLRVELLVAGVVVIGAWSRDVTVVENDTLTVENPSYVFAGIVEGLSGATGPQGDTGPQGPT